MGGGFESTAAQDSVSFVLRDEHGNIKSESTVSDSIEPRAELFMRLVLEMAVFIKKSESSSEEEHV